MKRRPGLMVTVTAALLAPALAQLGCSGIIAEPGQEPRTSGAGATTTPSGNGGNGGNIVPSGSGGNGGGGMVACNSPAASSVFHRLNTKQYQESVSAAMGLAIPLRADLPADSAVYGFDNNADTTITAALTQRYLDAARKAVTTALSTPAARAKLVTCDLMTGGAACVKTVLTNWLPKVFRRPVLPAEIDKYADYTTTCSSSAEAGLSCAMQAALISPKFLFRGEIIPSTEAVACTDTTPLMSTKEGILSQYALASRLSYFLWNSPPDDALYALAANGTLSKPEVLAAQVDRMLAAPMLTAHQFAFPTDFPSQYVPLSALSTAQPSPTLFPMFDEPLRQAMADESKLFFQEVLTTNGTALDLVRSNFTFVNARLAQHYGLPAVTGTQMRRVDTTGTARGGIPTQGSFLTATSSTENTSLILRAKWVLTSLLCVELPKADQSLIDSVPPPDPGLGLTNRESLEIRTKNPPCAGCHVEINPIGFGLETFGPIGQTRTLDRGKMIDPSGELPGGLKFANTTELLDVLRKDERFPGCVTKKLMTYALGRGMVNACDAQYVDNLAAQFKADGYKLRNQIVRIVQSDLFRRPRGRMEVGP